MAQNDVFKRYLDAGLEFGALTQARAEALVRDLVKAGEVQADQARDTVSDLVARSRRNSEKLLATVRREVRTQVTDRGLASKADLDKLEARVAKLLGTAAKVAPAARAAASSATKKVTAKKAPAKKAPAKKKPAAKKKASAKKAPARKAPAKKRS